jgi:hypothetical protein
MSSADWTIHQRIMASTGSTPLARPVDHVVHWRLDASMRHERDDSDAGLELMIARTDGMRCFTQAGSLKSGRLAAFRLR